MNDIKDNPLREALEETTAFLNLMKGSALQQADFFNQERRDQIFQECVRLTTVANDAMLAEAVRVPFDLSEYINQASINASDAPHVVVEKLQRAIEAAPKP